MTRSRLARLGLWLLAALLMIALVGGVALAIDHFTEVTVTIDVGGQMWEHHTHAQTVGDALDEAGVLLDDEDEVWPALSAPLEDDLTITVNKASVLVLDVDGHARQIRTQAANPLDILAERDISLEPYDRLEVDGELFSPDALATADWDTPPTQLRVMRSVELTIVDGNSTVVLHTTAADVGRALDDAGLTLYLADQVSPALNTLVSAGMQITIVRAVPITVIADGEQLETRTLGPAVGDALTALGIAPIGLDYTIPSLDTPLEPGMVIQVVRITEDIVIETQPIIQKTIYHPDPQLEAGETRVIQGQAGLREQHVRIRYADGREVSREIQSEMIVRSPKPDMIAYGTR
ncbi:MAG: DUF348 domain-containing protein [Chloroflexi bacterium]|nr:DUF348 domain-containing protein [Chloroflexota bacterium]